MDTSTVSDLDGTGWGGRGRSRSVSTGLDGGSWVWCNWGGSWNLRGSGWVGGDGDHGGRVDWEGDGAWGSDWVGRDTNGDGGWLRAFILSVESSKQKY